MRPFTTFLLRFVEDLFEQKYFVMFKTILNSSQLYNLTLFFFWTRSERKFYKTDTAEVFGILCYSFMKYGLDECNSLSKISLYEVTYERSRRKKYRNDQLSNKILIE
ncbi:hypothetical protein V1478_004389 [Vespula squamosa]|uniref:Uncharacterized protein n=1 Tax=Vespula squamosa TaxID=30214 RepID=A0ABD2BH55_VESSQ